MCKVLNLFTVERRGRCSDLMVSALVSGLSGLSSIPGWGHFTLTVPLSTQVYKWVPANLNAGVDPAVDSHPIQGGVEIILVTSWYRNQD